MTPTLILLHTIKRKIMEKDNLTKLVLITGGSRGLGRNMALTLASRQTDVIITYNTQSDQADAVVAEIESLGRKAAAIMLDVSKSETFVNFINRLKEVLKQKFGRGNFDYLVNNAGIGIHAAFTETTSDQLDLLYKIHYKAPFLLSQSALPLMTDGGAIVNLSSGLARFSLPGYAAYGPLKAAIDSLSRYMAAELGLRKIRVNSIAPGAIETDFGGGVVRDNADMNRMIAGMTALGRVGLPDDIGSVVAFLCSDDSKWVNGQRIEISGGVFL
jgi:NAD(P)-dependent dehydrogenase (short-subunit alcohol dehydrogenase family)